MESSGSVSQASFADFVDHLDPRLSLIGVAYMPLVLAEDLDAFIAAMQAEQAGFDVMELGLDGETAPVARDRTHYWPVQYFVAGEFLETAVPPEEGNATDLGFGLDIAVNPEWRVSLERSLVEDRPIVSDFLHVEFDEIVIGKAFIVAVPVHASGDPTGAVAAPMIDVLLPSALEIAITSDIDWEILPTIPPGAADPSSVWNGTVQLPGATWALQVRPAAGATPIGKAPVILVVLVGLVATGLLATVAGLLQLRSRSRTRLQQLQRISEDKDRFLAAVSHEIRTPLTAVAGLAHELRDRPDDFGPEEAGMLLEMVAEQSDEVAAIVEDLLVAARSDIRRVSIHCGPIDVRREADLALATAGVRARLVGETAIAWADAQRVRQILRNLLTNAGRYGGPEIEVRFRTTAREVIVTVADNGPSIPDRERSRMFAPYTTVHDEHGAVGSVGLGLFISRRLAEVMRGGLAYRHDGSWSLFELTLPRVEAVDRESAAAEERGVVVG
jgi:signal transduction histidine kinase